jgi:very-short-patch-repair endonuclease
MLARSERIGMVTREEVRAMVRRHPRHRGARVLWRILDDDLPAAFTRSRAEEKLLALIRAARLPAPELNARLLQYEVDFLWRAPRLVAEVDGIAYHGSARAFVEDRRRDAALMAAGYRVLRVTWPDLTREPEATLVRLAQALSYGSASITDASSHGRATPGDPGPRTPASRPPRVAGGGRLPAPPRRTPRAPG